MSAKSLLQPCSDTDCTHEGMGASVVSGCDALPVLQPAEHALDAIALFVKLDTRINLAVCTLM